MIVWHFHASEYLRRLVRRDLDPEPTARKEIVRRGVQPTSFADFQQKIPIMVRLRRPGCSVPPAYDRGALSPSLRAVIGARNRLTHPPPIRYASLEEYWISSPFISSWIALKLLGSHGASARSHSQPQNILRTRTMETLHYTRACRHGLISPAKPFGGAFTLQIAAALRLRCLWIAWAT
jgi:hypothetical protein